MHNLFKIISILCLMLFASIAISGETTTTVTKTITNEDGTQTVVEETTTIESTSEAEQQATESGEEAATDLPNIVGPDGATGVIRRSDRRQDRRAGDPRID